MSNPLDKFLPTAQLVVTNYQKQILDRKSKLEGIIKLLATYVSGDGIKKSKITDINNANDDEKKNYYNFSKLELNLETSINLTLIIVCTTDLKTGNVIFTADNIPNFNYTLPPATGIESVIYNLTNALQLHFNSLNKGTIDEDEVFKMIW